MSVEDYSARLTQHKGNVQTGRASAHKICMLLAVLDFARSGELVGKPHRLRSAAA